MLHYAVFDDLERCTPQEVQRLLPLVSPERREKSLRYKHLFGQFACLKSYEMLTSLLWQHFGLPAGITLHFDYNEHGKPRLMDYPDLHFNVSHCRCAIAVAVDTHPVGIDVERHILPSDSLLRRTMTESERHIIQHASSPEEAFSRLWTQKEAVFKLQGTGITDNIRDILSPTPDNVSIITTSNEAKHYCFSVAQERR